MLFKLPSDAHEVKKLTAWDASRITKQMTGKLAPGLDANDIQGHPLSLAAFKGRTVLLDFWATWCPPCRTDLPELEKLNQRYATRGLAIIGVSVDEDRQVVERFLRDNGKSYPIVLTTENQLARLYQVGSFPTYIVIDKEGNISAAAEGAIGFDGLKKLLKKAGMEIE
jgi:cytochrome c-type biogenesis protein